MAKHHWSKKAVLASLMLGASVLVSTATQAEINSHDNTQFTVKEAIAKQTFDKTVEDLIKLSLTEEDSPERSQEIRDYLASFDTKQLKELLRNWWEQSWLGQQGEQANNILTNLESKFIQLKAPKTTNIERPILFKELLGGEILRRLQQYEKLVDEVKIVNSLGRAVEIKSQEDKDALQTALDAERNENKKLISLINTQEDELTTLKNKEEQITTQLNDSQQLNKNLQDKTKALEAKVQEAADEAKMLVDKVTEATQNNQELITKLEEGNKDLAKLKQKLEETTEDNKEEKAKLQAELDAKKTEVTNLQAQVAESSEKLQALEEAKKEAEAKVNSLTSEKAEIEAKLKDQSQLSEEEKAKLKKQLADIQSKIAEKDASIKSLEGQLDALKQQEHDTAPSTPETPQVPEVKPEDQPKAPSTPEVQPVPETKPQTPQTPKADKPSTPEKPEIKPAPTPAIPEVKPSKPHTPEKPGKAHPAAPKAHHAATPAAPHMPAPSANTAAPLPQTGDAATNPFFTVAALSVIASAGVLTTKRKED
ncbi:LPXTG cell wall anchor domain-containing protein [Streptococcus halichoeri]|uniref:LPXTG cell wall anchor domain-containing protein n=1 Tax=Streptococcus halichoeri TaxID=254785 RepID=UPI001358F6BF|nr:LPXTG cell wall anchor domain-containing protein [Streptococcus halichoeri]